MDVIEGGASCARLPVVSFVWLPISNTSSPPPAISAYANHGLSHTLPLSVADRMYLVQRRNMVRLYRKNLTICRRDAVAREMGDRPGRFHRSARE